MSIENLLPLVSKFPTSNKDGVFFNGNLVSINSNCTTCQTKDCIMNLKLKPFKDNYICSKGYNCYHIRINESYLSIIGVFLSSNNRISKSNKKNQGKYCTSQAEIKNEIQKIEESISFIDNLIDSLNQKETLTNFAMLHDIKTSIGIAYGLSEKLQYKAKENIDNQYINLINDICDSLELTNSQLSMIDIVNNPASITYGSKIRSNIYQLFHKVSKLFNNKLSQRKIDWEGQERIPDVYCYQSIMLIPILLIDNAIKYSTSNMQIKINFSLIDSCILVNITSFGLTVNDDDIPKLKTKYFRGKNAVNDKKSGMGIGLWMANEILKEHGSELKYSKSSESNGYGYNSFFFYLKK